MSVSGDVQASAFDVALKRRQALMGVSGPSAIFANLKVFRIAAFATLGGLVSRRSFLSRAMADFVQLYGYNQGTFSGESRFLACEARYVRPVRRLLCPEKLRTG